MKNKFNEASTLILFLIVVFVTAETIAQSVQRQSVASTGSYLYNNGYLVQQTIGQPYSTTTFYSNKLGFRPGFQQFPSSISLKLQEDTFTNINLKVYPNPATYTVTIESSETINDVLFQVVDINGKLILNEKINEMKTHSINCETWINGVYFISLSNNQNNKYSTKLIIN
ncbi:MAG: T9SS type A sorting domain-containing protein [Bacteroidales bacterium]|nr:T9SS type A sorting domain-containing protein [Bacteroidales bacterium]